MASSSSFIRLLYIFHRLRISILLTVSYGLFNRMSSVKGLSRHSLKGQRNVVTIRVYSSPINYTFFCRIDANGETWVIACHAKGHRLFLLLLGHLNESSSIVIPSSRYTSTLFRSRYRYFVREFVIGENVSLFVRVGSQLVVISQRAYLFLCFKRDVFSYSIIK